MSRRQGLDPRYAFKRLSLEKPGHVLFCDGPDSWFEKIDMNAIPADVSFVLVPRETGGSYGAGWIRSVETSGPVELIPVSASLCAAIVRGDGVWVGYADPDTYQAEVRWHAGHARTGSDDGYCRWRMKTLTAPNTGDDRENDEILRCLPHRAR